MTWTDQLTADGSPDIAPPPMLPMKAIHLLGDSSQRCERFVLGKIRIYVNTPAVCSESALTVATGLTGVTLAEILPFLLDAYVLPCVERRGVDSLRVLDVSSSSGLTGLLLAKIGCRKVDLFSRSEHTRMILRDNTRRNGAACEVLDALDPRRHYHLVVVDAFEIAQPHEIRALGELLTHDGLLVLFGFPAAYLPTLQKHISGLETSWQNECCVVKCHASALKDRKQKMLPQPVKAEVDPWSDFERRIGRWATCFPSLDTEPFWHIGVPRSNALGDRSRRSIILLPSLIYGTGSNPITRLMLAVLPEACGQIEPDHDSLLDLGCGSGVLAIAATRLGVRRVGAMDIADDAVELTRCNADLNGTSLDVASEVDPRRRYGLIVANLPGYLHEGYLPLYEIIVKPGGYVLMAGFDEQQEAGIRQAYSVRGFTVVTEHERFGWKALLLQRAA